MDFFRVSSHLNQALFNKEYMSEFEFTNKLNLILFVICSYVRNNRNSNSN